MGQYFMSPSYGELTIEETAARVLQYISDSPEDHYMLTLGTDSQSHDKTKIVMVIAVHRIAKGGIFFYDIKKIPLIRNIRQKIIYETQMSLQLADELLQILEHMGIGEYIVDYQIHCDIGVSGKTSQLIPEITAWVKGCGYNCQIKPNSYAASAIANKFSK